MQKFINKLHIRSIIKTAFCVLVFVVAQTAQAATLSLIPSNLQLSTGETAKIRVLVNTKGISVNAVEGLIKYDPSFIDVTSVSKLNSALNIWIEEPTIANAGGSISFNGGIINPGYTGGAGEVFSLTVRAKKTGSTQLTFSNTTVRASDGEGTDVLTTAAGTTFTINKPAAAPEVQPEVPKPVVKQVVEPIKKTVAISAPELVSATHPNQEVWYSNRSADVSWSKNANASGVQVVFNSSPNTIASGPVQYRLTTKALRQVRDGISYLHVRFVGQNSVSETAHYAIRVDTISPDGVSVATSTVDGTTMVEIFAKDAHSGIAYADISLDAGAIEKVPVVDGRLIYKPNSSVVTGMHSALIQVYDNAGNKVDFISPLYLEIAQPEVVIPVTELVPTTETTLVKQNSFEKAWIWFKENGRVISIVLLSLAAIALMALLIVCLKKRRTRSRSIESLESGYNQSIINLKQEAYQQVLYLERIAQLRDLTQAEKDMYKKCRSILS